MNKKRDCSIVQDLLPNYIDKLTNSETNQYIQEHIDHCDDCKKFLTSMQKDLVLPTPKREDREIKYIKKFNNKMRILKTILILIFLLFIVTIGRKMIILTNLSNKAESYVNSNNFHRVTYLYQKDNYTKAEIYKLGSKKLIVLTNLTNGEKKLTRIYANNDIAEKIYTQTDTKKTVNLNPNLQLSVEIQNSFYTENIWQLFIASIPVSITTKHYDNQECYYITNFTSSYSPFTDGIYVNKETGLNIRIVESESKDSDGVFVSLPAEDFTYEFNTVTEEDFIEPDINEYEIIS